MERIIVLLAFCMMIGCQSKSSESKFSFGGSKDLNGAFVFEEDEPLFETNEESDDTSEPFNLEKGSKIIKNGSLYFEVSQLEKAKMKIDSLVSTMNAYYENELFRSVGDRNEYSLTIRVPIVRFDSMINILDSGLGRLVSKNISAQDVTEEYVDLNIRLESNLAYLKQYKSILLKASSIREILDVQEKIRRIEEEIESKKGRLKYLDFNISYSTIDLVISELVSDEISNKPKFGLRMLNAFNQGIRSFLNFIVNLMKVWPFILLLGFLFIARKPILKRFRKQRTTRKRNNDI